MAGTAIACPTLVPLKPIATEIANINLRMTSHRSFVFARTNACFIRTFRDRLIPEQRQAAIGCVLSQQSEQREAERLRPSPDALTLRKENPYATALLSAAVILYAFALSISAAEARPIHKQGRHDLAVASQCLREFGKGVHAPAQKNAPRATPESQTIGNPVIRREASIGATRRYCWPNRTAGRIIIACDLAKRMKGFIADVVARGFRGRGALRLAQPFARGALAAFHRRSAAKCDSMT